jgi:solute carrier family 30 (zinc transporter), member 9
MAAPANSFKSVLAALAGNSLVTVIKFIAFALSGSGAMLSEAIHSAADTGNQVLLFLGLRRGGRPRDEDFNYGYGGERFIFGILSAAGIFFVGCGVTVYHGISALAHPHVPEIGPVTLVVLGISLLIEGSVLLYAVAGVRAQAKDSGFLRYVREKADPAVLAILLEDSAAVLGLFLAGFGIALTYITENPLWDALASITVGVLLGLIAIFLVMENRELLLGRAVPEDIEQRFVQLVRSFPSIASIHDVKTRQITPELYHLKAEIRFHPNLLVDRLRGLLPAGASILPGAAHEGLLRELSRHALQGVSDEIDALENAVKAAIPEAKHIDFEVDHTALAAGGQGPPELS